MQATPLYALRNLSLRPNGLSTDAPDVLRALTLSLHAGERVALIGPSGAGKTSLLNVLALSQAPTVLGAFLRLNQAAYGLHSKQLHGLRKQHFYAPQVAPLPPRQRVVNAVMAGALPQWGALKSLRQWLASSYAAVAHASLFAFGLDAKLYERVDTLSGGERQRVGLARALVAQQAAGTGIKAWFLDEPLSALDPALGEQALHVLLEAAALNGVLVVASLHHVALARSHFDRIVALKQGELMFDLPRAQVTDEMIAALYGGAVEPVQHPVLERAEPSIFLVPCA